METTPIHKPDNITYLADYYTHAIIRHRVDILQKEMPEPPAKIKGLREYRLIIQLEAVELAPKRMTHQEHAQLRKHIEHIALDVSRELFLSFDVKFILRLLVLQETYF